MKYLIQKKNIKEKIILLKIRTKNLTKSQINKICKIKIQKWRFSFKSQKNYFLNNYNSNDIHHLVLINRKIIGYNCLKFIKYFNKMIIIFDSLIIDKHYRKKGISKIILESSVKQIFKKKLECYLYCEKILQKYYEKYGWKRVNKKKLNLLNKTKLILMKFK